MKCPYCNKETESGVIQSQHALRWQKARYLFMTQKEHDITLSEQNIWKGSAIRSYLCRDCKKIIINYSEECDLNRKKNETDDI